MINQLFFTQDSVSSVKTIYQRLPFWRNKCFWRMSFSHPKTSTKSSRSQSNQKVFHFCKHQLRVLIFNCNEYIFKFWSQFIQSFNHQSCLIRFYHLKRIKLDRKLLIPLPKNEHNTKLIQQIPFRIAFKVENGSIWFLLDVWFL